MNYQRYKILKCIKNCPDYFVPKIVISNIIKIDNNELNKDLDFLVKNNYLVCQKRNNTFEYCFNYNSKKQVSKYRIELFKKYFSKYIFPFILAIIPIFL